MLDYLFTAANGMASELYRSIGEPEQRSLTVAAAIGCNAMIDWSDDRQFREIVRSLAQRQRIDAPPLAMTQTSQTAFARKGEAALAAGFAMPGPEAILHDRVEEFLR